MLSTMERISDYLMSDSLGDQWNVNFLKNMQGPDRFYGWTIELEPLSQQEHGNNNGLTLGLLEG